MRVQAFERWRTPAAEEDAEKEPLCYCFPALAGRGSRPSPKVNQLLGHTYLWSTQDGGFQGRVTVNVPMVPKPTNALPTTHIMGYVWKPGR